MFDPGNTPISLDVFQGSNIFDCPQVPCQNILLSLSAGRYSDRKPLQNLFILTKGSEQAVQTQFRLLFKVYGVTFGFLQCFQRETIFMTSFLLS